MLNGAKDEELQLAIDQYDFESIGEESVDLTGEVCPETMRGLLANKNPILTGEDFNLVAAELEAYYEGE